MQSEISKNEVKRLKTLERRLIKEIKSLSALGGLMLSIDLSNEGLDSLYILKANLDAKGLESSVLNSVLKTKEKVKGLANS